MAGAARWPLMFGKLSRKNQHKLESEGVVASATVLEVAERGMSVTSGNDSLVANTEVVLKTRLRVEPEGQPAFEIERKFRYAQLSIPSVGTRLSVRYDPADPETMMIDSRPPVVDMPGLPGGKLDLGAMLDTIKETKSAHPGDRMAMADALKAQMGLNTMGMDPSNPMNPMVMMAGMPGMAPDPVAQLERLAALHTSGALTDAEFAAEKAKLLAA